MTFENADNFIYNSSVGIHMVSADGVIEYANACELETLGYDKEEYVGHHVSEFQMNEEALNDMMVRLGKFEILKNYPSKVRGKNGVKYMLYNSSVYEDNGEFRHTRCYATEIEKEIYDVFVSRSKYYQDFEA